MRWLDGITHSIDVNLSKHLELVKDRGALRAAVQGAKRQTRLMAEQQQRCCHISFGIRNSRFPRKKQRGMKWGVFCCVFYQKEILSLFPSLLITFPIFILLCVSRAPSSVTWLVTESESESTSFMSDSRQPHGRPRNSPGQKGIVFPFSRGSSQPRDRTHISHITGSFFTS